MPLRVCYKQLSVKSWLFARFAGEDKKVIPSDKKESKETIKRSNSNSLKNRSKNKKPIKTDKDEEKQSFNENTGEVAKEDKKSVEANSENTKMVVPKDQSDENFAKKVLIDEQIEDSSEKQNGNEVKDQSENEVVLRLNPDGDDADELLQENVISEEAKKRVKNDTTVVRTKPVHPNKDKADSISCDNKRQRKIGEEEEDIYDPNRPVLASVVRVTQRKSSVPIEMYANKKLLLKAVKDATDSTQDKRKRRLDDTDYTPTPIKKRLGERQNQKGERSEPLDPKDLRNYLKVSKKGIRLNLWLPFTYVRCLFIAERLAHYSSERIEIKMSENLISDSETKVSEDSTKEKMRQKIVYNETESSSETLDPQFVVTLNGIDHDKYLKNSECKPIDKRILNGELYFHFSVEDRIMFDEEMDEELVNEPEEGMGSENLENETLAVNKIKERCRFWPSCKNGDDCEFLHPNTPCK